MTGILMLESLTRGNTLKQGDKTPLTYKLLDADGDNLNVAGKTAIVRLVHPNYLTIGYEKSGLLVSQDDTVTFTIDNVIPARKYNVEIIVDNKFVFPSRSVESKFTVDKSTLGTEASIIEIVGVDEVVRRAVELINIELPGGGGGGSYDDTDVRTHMDNTNNPHNVTKSQVGLGSVDNVKQATKAEFDSHNQDNTRHITASERTAWNSKQDTLGFTPENTSNKGQAGGYAGLDTTGRVPLSQLPDFEGGDGDSSVEVAEARVDVSGHTNATLKERLDKEHNGLLKEFEQRGINVQSFGAVGGSKWDMTDDTEAIQAAVDYVYNLDGGGTLYFPAGVYWISSPIIVPTVTEFNEVSWLGQGERSTAIRPLNEMETTVYMRGRGGYVKGIDFNGANNSNVRLVKYGMIANEILEKTFSGVSFSWNKLHGLYIQKGNNNLVTFNEACRFHLNGTIIDGVDATGSGNTINFGTFNPLASDVYKGGYIRIGDGVGSVYQITEATDSSVSISPALPSPITNQTYQINLGNGLHTDRHGDNNAYGVYDAHFVGNMAAGFMIRGLYGHNIKGGNFDFNGICGIHIGNGIYDYTPTYSSVIDHPYMEGSGYANIILDYPSGLSIIEPLLPAPINGYGAGLSSIVSFTGYAHEYNTTSIIYNGKFYEYLRNYGNEPVIPMGEDERNISIHRFGPVTSTTINLPEPSTHIFGETLTIYVSDSGGGTVNLRCEHAKINDNLGTVGVDVPSGKGFQIFIFYNPAQESWMVSHTSSDATGGDTYDDTEVKAHMVNTSNPHAVTKSQVGLANVNNTSDANKPVSTAMQSALNSKADKSQVLTNVPANAKFTDTTYTAGTGINISGTTISATGGGDDGYDDTAIVNHIQNTENPHDVTKSQVGLGNVDNTSDINKPVSSAVQSALGNKADKTQVLTNVPANAKFTDTTYTAGTGINISGTTISATGGSEGGYDDTAVVNHMNNTDIHVTSAKKLEWDGKQAKLSAGTNVNISGNTISATDTKYSNATVSSSGLMSSTDKSKLDGVANNANNYTHPANHPASMITESTTKRFVSDTEKTTWNAKVDLAEVQSKIDLALGDVEGALTQIIGGV